MSISSLFPSALAAWSPRRARRSDRRAPLLPHPAPAVSHSIIAPPGTVAVETEIRAVIAAASRHAQERFIELEFAIQPRLLVQGDAALFRACMQALLREAIDRAQSGVLITATAQADAVELTLLDDGERPPASSDSDARQEALLPGVQFSASFQPERGSTISLRLPRSDRLLPSDEQFDELCFG